MLWVEEIVFPRKSAPIGNQYQTGRSENVQARNMYSLGRVYFGIYIYSNNSRKGEHELEREQDRNIRQFGCRRNGGKNDTIILLMQINKSDIK